MLNEQNNNELCGLLACIFNGAATNKNQFMETQTEIVFN